MTFDLDDLTLSRRRSAEACAADVLAPVAGAIDRDAHVPVAVAAAARAALASPDDGVAWAVTLEALASASASAALVAAAETLGLGPASASAQWSGLRGADVDGLRGRVGALPAGDVAVTAILLGTGRAAVAACVEALRPVRATADAA